MSSNRAESEKVESNAQASVQRATSSSRRPVSKGQWGKAKEAFFQMMNKWFIEFVSTNLAVQQPPPLVSQPVLDMPQGIELVRTSKPHVDKICKYEVEKFRATAEDDPMVEYTDFRFAKRTDYMRIFPNSIQK